MVPKCSKELLEHNYLLKKHVKQFCSYCEVGDYKNARFLYLSIIGLLRYSVNVELDKKGV